MPHSEEERARISERRYTAEELRMIVQGLRRLWIMDGNETANELCLTIMTCYHSDPLNSACVMEQT